MYEPYVIAKHVPYNLILLGNHSIVFKKSAFLNDWGGAVAKMVDCGRESAEVGRLLTQLS